MAPIQQPKQLAIIGAGLTGLTAAMDLCEAGHSVTIFEQENQAGGLCRGFAEESDKDSIEMYYHHLLTSDKDAVDCFAHLGIAETLEWLPPRNAFIRNGKAYPFSRPVDLLSFAPVSPLRRILMGLHILSARFIRNWHSLDGMTAADWVRRHTGKAVFNAVWGPLLNAKFGDESERIAAVWLANKLKLRGSSQKPGVGGESLGYPRGGFRVLIEAMLRRLKSSGVNLFLAEPVEHVCSINEPLPGDAKFRIRTKQRIASFDEILCTVAPGTFAELMPEFPDVTRALWRNIRYQGNLCLMLELDRQLSPYYWSSIADHGFPFVAVIEHTNLLPVSRYNSHIVYVSSYLNPQSRLFCSSDDEVIKVFEEALGKLMPAFRNTTVRSRKLSRSPHAQPVVTTGYAAQIPPLATPVQGAWLASMAQIFPQDRGINYAIRLGHEVASAMLKED